jgi:hypothetical protein
MSHEPVYCPKCGFQSPPDARFCKRCGTNLEAVSRVLTGQIQPAVDTSSLSAEMEIAYAKELSKAIYGLLSSVGVFLVMLFIFRGAFWVWFLLFWVANSVRDVVQAFLLKQQIKNPVAFQAALEAYKEEKHKKRRRRRRDRERLETPPAPVTLPPPRVPSGEYVPPARTTGELEKPKGFEFDEAEPPPSVTEGTTRLLEDEEREGYAPPSAARQRE